MDGKERMGSLMAAGLNQAVAPAQAGAHYVSQSVTTGEIGSSRRWSDVVLQAGRI
jgi:hypothetical protein